MHLIIKKYRDTYWAIYDDNELICVTVYKKGAVGVAEKLKAIIGEGLVIEIDNSHCNNRNNTIITVK